jgi:polyisoprenyl-phosphate glycosyltransferase
VLILGSTQLILFGLLGEYVGRMYLETKRRPLFVIDQVLTQQAMAAGQHDATRERASIPGEVN